MSVKLQNINLGHAFETIVKDNKTEKAIKFDLHSDISYSELNSKANQLARYFISIGINKNDVVAISGIKRFETYICIIACLKLGAIYSVFDYNSPLDRLIKIFDKCKPKVIFSELELIQILTKNYSDNPIYVDNNRIKISKNIEKYTTINLSETKTITASNPAYIMFTSGSTGTPKGVLISHSSVLNMISWSLKTFNFDRYDNLTNVNPLYFDNSVFDLYSALFSGASLVPFSKEDLSQPLTLINKVDELKCTSWFSVPSLLIYLDTVKVLNKNNLTHLKKIIFGGEAYPKPKLKNLFNIYYKRLDFYNVYGPTEGTCICSNYKISTSDFTNLEGLPPLGKLNENFSFLILNEQLRKVKDGEVGELCLLGPNIALGYYNDWDRSKQVFLQNPLNSSFSELIYKTGDLVRFDCSDENIYFVARKDNQIKHMGYRIELDEIEHALSLTENISESAVIQTKVTGMSQIIAFISLVSGCELSSNQIKLDLKKILPAYMIPNKIVFLDMLPKNANGKIDRKELRNSINKGSR